MPELDHLKPWSKKADTNQRQPRMRTKRRVNMGNEAGLGAEKDGHDKQQLLRARDKIRIGPSSP